MTETQTPADPFAAPSSGSFMDKATKRALYNDKTETGALLAVEVLRFDEDVKTKMSKEGVKNPAITANVHVIADGGEHTGRTFNRTPLYGKVLTDQLQERVGTMVLGRWVKGDPKPGFEDNPPWKLEPVSQGTPDYQTALDWYNSRKADPFA